VPAPTETSLQQATEQHRIACAIEREYVIQDPEPREISGDFGLYYGEVACKSKGEKRDG
jgi:hypothetical protein